jgi:pimeloyl-ACP methyl ester carboxylesterase
MASIKPYKINISNYRLERLMQKLALADFPDHENGLEDDSWVKGPPVGEIKRLVEVWQTVYNWRGVESRLNQLPQFMASIDIASLGALDIHFVHKKSTMADAIPLLFLHGWPGSFYEVSRIIDPLVQGDDKTGPSFHVVAPSLVDFGFSSPSKVNTSTFRFGIILTSVLTICRWDLALSTMRRLMTNSCRTLAITITVSLLTTCESLFNTTN